MTSELAGCDRHREPVALPVRKFTIRERRYRRVAAFGGIVGGYDSTSWGGVGSEPCLDLW